MPPLKNTSKARASRRWSRKNKQWHVAWAKAHRKQKRDSAMRYRNNHKEKARNATMLWRKRRKRYVAKKKHEAHWKLKLETIEAYGKVCYCCKEAEPAFLSIDHTFGNGKKDRAKWGGAGGFYASLKRRNWPKRGYRLSCMNCQFGTRYGKTCPHKLLEKRGELWQ